MYIFANRLEPGYTALGTRREDALVLVLSPDGRRQIASAVVRHADGRDWWIYHSSIAPDERHLTLSYHGTTTSGADVIDASTLRRTCNSPHTLPGNGCIALAHGDSQYVGGRLIATTGSPLLIATTQTGAPLTRWNTGLVRNHIMNFAVTGDNRNAFVVASCGYTGGLAAVNLNSTATRLLVRPGSSDLCGARLALLSPRLLVIASPAIRSNFPSPVPTHDRLLFVDTTRGLITRQVALRAEPLDLLTLGSPSIG